MLAKPFAIILLHLLTLFPLVNGGLPYEVRMPIKGYTPSLPGRTAGVFGPAYRVPGGAFHSFTWADLLLGDVPSYAGAPDACLTDTGCATGFTVAFWLKQDLVAADASESTYLVHSGGGDATSEGWYVRSQAGSRTFYQAGVNENQKYYVIDFQIDPMRWYHVHLVFEPNVGLSLYVNHQQVGPTVSNWFVTASGTGAPTVMTVGAANTADPSPYAVSIDQFEFSNTYTVPTFPDPEGMCSFGFAYVAAAKTCVTVLTEATAVSGDAAKALCADLGATVEKAPMTSEVDTEVRTKLTGTYFLLSGDECLRFTSATVATSAPCSDATATATQTVCRMEPAGPEQLNYLGCFPAVDLVAQNGVSSAGECLRNCTALSLAVAARHSNGTCGCARGFPDVASALDAYPCTEFSAWTTKDFLTNSSGNSSELYVTHPLLSSVRFMANGVNNAKLMASEAANFSFSATSGNIYQVEVSIDDGSSPSIVSVDSNVYHTFATAGTYNITWRVLNSHSSSSDSIEIDVAAPETLDLIMGVAIAPANFLVNESSVINVKVFGGVNVTCEFLYGDGFLEVWHEESPDETSLNYTYTLPGTYDVSLLCTSAHNWQKACGQIYVATEPLQATLVSNIVVVQVGQPIIAKWSLNQDIPLIQSLLVVDSEPLTSAQTYSQTNGTTMAYGTEYSCSEAGTFNGTVLVWYGNEVISLPITVVLELRMNKLTLFSESNFYLTGSTFSLMAMVDYGSNVEITFRSPLSNGTGSEVIIESQCGSLLINHTVTMNFTFVTSGTYTITVDATNLVSCLTQTFVVYYQAPVPPGLNLTVDVYQQQLFENFTFLLVPPGSISDPPRPLYMTLDFGDGIAADYDSVDLDTPITIPHYYTVPGTMVVSALLYTGSSMQNYSIVVQVSCGDNLTIVPSIEYAKVNEEVALTVSGVSGLNVLFEINMPSGIPSSYSNTTFIVLDPSVSFLVNVTYPADGIYYVSGHAFNYHLNTNTTIPIYVLYPIEEQIKAEPATIFLIHPIATSNISVYLVNNQTTPTNVSCVFSDSFSTRSEDLVELSVTTPVSNVINYTNEGNFTVNINCSNTISTQSTTANVVVLLLNLSYFEMFTKDIVPFPKNTNQGEYSVSFKLFEQTVMPPGITVLWDWGDGTTTSVTPFTDFSATHTFTQRGMYTVKLKLMFESQVREETFTVQVGALNVSLSHLLINTEDATLSAVNVTCNGFINVTTYTLNSTNIWAGPGANVLFVSGVTGGYTLADVYPFTDPVIFTATFTNEGVYTVTVTASNSSLTEEVEYSSVLTAYHPVGATLTISSETIKITTPPGWASITLTDANTPLYNPTNATCSYSSSLPGIIIPDDVSPNLQLLSKNLTFTAPGDFIITSNCSNPVSQGSATYNATVLAFDLNDVNLTTNSPVSLQPNQRGIGQFNFSLFDNTAMPSSIIYQWTFGDGLTSAAAPEPFLLEHEYMQRGVYPMTLNMSYGGSFRIFSFSMIVGLLRGNLTTFLVKTYTEPCNVIVGGLSGTVIYTLTYDSGIVFTETFTGVLATEDLSINSTITTPGVYRVHINAHNGTHNVSLLTETTVVVQNEVKNLSLSSDSDLYLLQSDVNTLAVFNISRSGLPPTNTSCLVSFGDTTAAQTIPLDLESATSLGLPGHAFVFNFNNQHEYPNVTANCSNDVSWQMMSKIVTVSEKLQGLTYDIFGKNEILVNFTHLIQVAVSSGLAVTFRIDYGDGTTAAISPAHPNKTFMFEHVYPQIKFNFGNLTAYTQFESTMVALPQIFSFLSFNITLEAFDLSVEQDHLFNFSLSYAKVPMKLIAYDIFLPVPDNVSLTWTYGDGSFLTENMTSFDYYHKYFVTGLFNVTLKVKIKDTGESKVLWAMVNVTKPCVAPTVSLVGSASRTSLYSSRFLLSPVSVMNCARPHKRQWTIVSPTSPDYNVEQYNFPSGYETLTVAAKTLPIGSYSIKYEIWCAHDTNLNASTTITLTIQPTPLNSAIPGSSMLTIGQASAPYRLNALAEDPDLPTDSSHLSYSWTCTPTATAEVSLTDVHDTAALSGEANCFGTGAASSSELRPTIVGSSLAVGLYVYKMVVAASGSARKIAAWKMVEVVAGEPRNVNLTCASNCDRKMDPSKLYSLQAQCSNCDDAGTRYQWELLVLAPPYQSVPLTSSMLNIENWNSSVTNTKSLSFLPNSLTGGNKYRIKLAVTEVGKVPGYALFEVDVDLPPYNGTCAISPANGGIQIETSFTLTCKNWLDEGLKLKRPGDNLIDHDYELWVNGTLVWYGSTSTSTAMQLPHGAAENDFRIDATVRVIDQFHVYAEYSTSVQVKPLVTDIGEANANSTDYLNGLVGSFGQSLVSITESGSPSGIANFIIATTSITDAMTEPPDETDNLVESMLAGALQTGGENGGVLGVSVDPETGETVSLTFEQMNHFIEPPVDPAFQKAKEELKNNQTLALQNLVEGMVESPESLNPSALVSVIDALTAVIGDKSAVSSSALGTTVDTLQKAMQLAEMIATQKSNLDPSVAETLISSLLSAANQVNDVLESPPELIPETDPLQSSFGFSEESNEKENLQQELSKTTPGEKTYLIDKIRAQNQYFIQKALEMKKIHAEGMVSGVRKMMETVSKLMVPGQDSYSKIQSHLEVNVMKLKFDELPGKSISTSSVSVTFPDREKIISGGNEYATVMLAQFKKSNPLSFANKSKDITTDVIHLGVMNDDVTMNISVRDLKLTFQHSNVVPKTETSPMVSSGDKTRMYYIRVWVEVTDNKCFMNFRLPDNVPNMAYIVLGKIDDFPSYEDYDMIGHVTNIGNQTNIMLECNVSSPTVVVVGLKPLSLLTPASTSGRRKRAVGGGSTGVAPGLNVSGLVADMPMLDLLDPVLVQAALDENQGKAPITVNGIQLDEQRITYVLGVGEGNYSLQTASMGCRAYDSTSGSWGATECEAGPGSSASAVVCACPNTDKSNFGASFFVAPNMIDFNLVFSNFDPRNVGVVLLCVALLVLYCVLVFFARKKDKRDIVRWGVMRLVDNNPAHQYYYLVSVHTGLRSQAGTRSSIGFSLIGGQKESGSRVLFDGMRGELGAGSINRYLMSTASSLGMLEFIRIWHDNAGKDTYGSWFLDKVVVHDVQTNETFVFVADRWLAVDEEDGRLDCVVPAASREEVFAFSNMFADNVKIALTDEHLWFSMLIRPSSSNFTRVQRLTVGMSLLFLTMIASAMFYGREGSEERPMGLSIGPIKLSLAQLWIAFLSLIIVTPVNFLILILFKKAKPRTVPVVTKQRNYDGDLQRPIDFRPRHRKGFVASKISKIFDRKYVDEESGDEGTGDDDYQVEDEVMLSRMLTPFAVEDDGKLWPWWCAVVAYVLAFLAIGASSFFCVLYSLDWGTSKSNEWIVSLFLSFLQDIFFVDPFKVIVMALVLTMIFKKPGIKGESVRPQDLSTENVYSKSYLDRIRHHKVGRSAPVQISEEELKDIRIRRTTKRNLHETIRRLFLYFLVLTLVWLISYSNRDERSFQLKNVLDKHLVQNFRKISNPDEFMVWIKDTFVPTFFADFWYNGASMHWRQRRFLADTQSYRVGPARFRIVKMPPGDPINNIFPTLPHTFFPRYNIFKEDKRDSCIGWKYDSTCNPYEKAFNYTSDAWRYTSSKEIWGVPVWAKLQMYSGGGYIANHDVNKGVSKKILEELWRNLWLDKATRALMIEFTIYNANANLFSTAILTIEQLEMGGFLLYDEINTFRLYMYEGANGLITLIMQIIFIGYVVYLLVIEGYKVKKQKCRYFKSGWNILETIIIVGSIAAIAMYIIRYGMAKSTMRNFTKNPKAFLNFQHLTKYDLYMGYFVAFLIFFFTIKMLKMLEFNSQVNSVIIVLKHGGRDLTNFGVVFFLLYLSFSYAGHLLFGQTVKEFATMTGSMSSLFKALLGKNQYKEIVQAEENLGNIYFGLYMLIAVIVLVNFLIAILCDAIYEAKIEQSVKKNQLELVSYIKFKIKGVLGIKTTFNYGVSRPGDGSAAGGKMAGKMAGLSEKEQRASLWYKTLLQQVDQLKSMVGPEEHAVSERKLAPLMYNTRY